MRLLEMLFALDKRQRLAIGGALVALLSSLVLLSFLSDRADRMYRKGAAREQDLTELMGLKVKIVAARATGIATPSPGSLTALVEATGISGKGRKVNPLPGAGDTGKQVAEVRIDGLTANELVNFLYRMESAAGVTLRKSSTKVRFDDPSRLDLAATFEMPSNTSRPAGQP